MKKLIIAFIALFLAGCAIGPDYKRPAVDLPETLSHKEVKESEAAKDPVNLAWWEQYNDPVLKNLIEIALKENKDLKIAAARVEQYMGLYGTTRSQFFPQIYGTGSAYKQRSSEILDPTPLQNTNIDPTFRTYQGFLTASWELDLWGKLRRADEAARANLLASEDARASVIMTLVSSVAGSYLTLRDTDRQLEIARQTAKTREESFNLFKRRYAGGVISELELTQVQSQYEEALAAIPYYEKSVAQQENALSVLLGRNPGSIPRGKAIDDLAMLAVPEGIRSDLLANRPDLREAEQYLVSANANIGVAKAQYFPSISLTGAYGSASSSLSDLFSGPAKAWNWGGQVTAPIFTFGGIAGQVKAAEAVQQQYLVKYQQSIQNAFREVEDALVDHKRSSERVEMQQRQVKTLTQYARIAKLRFDGGYTSYLEVLDADRSLFNAQLSLAKTLGDLSLSTVNIYKAMGGGWVVEADRIASPAPQEDKAAKEKPAAQDVKK